LGATQSRSQCSVIKATVCGNIALRASNHAHPMTVPQMPNQMKGAQTGTVIGRVWEPS
jgi:hypothetical protein